MENVALVTGADRGLGLELVREFLKKGYTVFAGKYLTKWTMLEELQAEYPEKLYIVDIDVTSEESIRAAREFVLTKTDAIDFLVNNAGISLGIWAKGEEGTILDENLDVDACLKVMNVNALGAIRVSKAFIRLVLNSEHRLIVNVSSEAGSIGTCWRQGDFAYCMSKAALNMAASIIHNSIHYAHMGQVMNFNPGGMVSYLGDTSSDENVRGVNEKHVKYPWISTSEAAQCMIEVIMRHEEFVSDHPAFLTRNGSRIPW